MIITEQHSEPEHVKDRQPYRVRIDGKSGDAIEIVEQMGGGFAIHSVTSMGAAARLDIAPINHSTIVVRAK